VGGRRRVQGRAALYLEQLHWCDPSSTRPLKGHRPCESEFHPHLYLYAHLTPQT
jgi:hypothetical protein